MGKGRARWDTMDKSHIRLSTLADHYLTTCRADGKTAATLRGYEEKLAKFIRQLLTHTYLAAKPIAASV